MVELTALMSAYGPNLIASPLAPPRDSLLRYWSCFKGAQRRWLDALHAWPRDVQQASPPERTALWEQTEPVLIEVFINEMPARVWGAILTASDRTRGICDAEPIARNILLGQMEVRQRALHLMVHGPHVTLDQIAAIDRLRRRIERWTDLFLGHLVKRYGLGDFAVDVERALDFGEEQLQAAGNPQERPIWDLYFVCLHAAFPEISPSRRFDEQFRLEICRSMLAAFPSDAFREAGPLKSTWLARLTRSSADQRNPSRSPVFT